MLVNRRSCVFLGSLLTDQLTFAIIPCSSSNSSSILEMNGLPCSTSFTQERRAATISAASSKIALPPHPLQLRIVLLAHHHT